MTVKKLKWSLATSIMALMFIAGCYYDNVEELYPDGCRINDVKYNDDVIPILEASNCLSCHNDADQQGGINLEGYENLLDHVDDGSLMGSIRHEQGWEPMPLTGNKMTSCSIARLQSWIDAGALNN